jgi:hypothetical protein
MKKIFFIILISLLIIIFTACRSESNTSKLDENSGIGNTGQENTLDISSENAGTIADEKLVKVSAGSSRFDIVAESGNSISSVDKEKVIKKLDDELGALFDSINGLEDK